jgi:hypothetical protein
MLPSKETLANALKPYILMPGKFDVERFASNFLEKRMAQIAHDYSDEHEKNDSQLERRRKRMKALYGFVEYPDSLRLCWGTMSPQGTDVILCARLDEQRSTPSFSPCT